MRGIWHLTQTINIADYNLEDACGMAGTLGRFQVSLYGKLTFDKEKNWTFTGYMQYKDVYDFVRAPNEDPNGYPSNEWSDQQTKLANKFLIGTGFSVYSPYVKVSQTSDDKSLDYFNGKSQEKTGGLLTKEKYNESEN